MSLRFAASAYLRDDTRDLVAALPEARVWGWTGTAGIRMAFFSPPVPRRSGSSGDRRCARAPRRCWCFCCRCASAGRAAAADVEAANRPPVWLTDASGQRFRVRFDPGERLILGAGAETLAADFAGLAAAPGFAVELGLLLRGDRPAPGWDVHWKRNHEIARLRLHPRRGARAAPPSTARSTAGLSCASRARGR